MNVRSAVRGFTISEVVVSIFLLSVALLAVAASITFGMNAADHARSITEANTYARVILEYVTANNLAWSTTVTLPTASSGVNDPAGVNQALGAPPLTTGGISFPADTPYRRHIEITGSNCTTDSGDVSWKLDVRQIAVFISWSEQGLPRTIVLKTFQRRPL